MAVLSTKKDSTAPTRKAPGVKAPQPVAVAPTPKQTTVATSPKKAVATQATSTTTNKPVKKTPKEKKPVDMSQMKTVVPKLSSQEKKGTVYHVSKRDNDGREWKVFIQESKKVIKLFNTQEEALKYAKGLCSNKADGSYVVLHGLNGKIRKF